jgi:glycosyltransferase involved in cell wall biosynthesis
VLIALSEIASHGGIPRFNRMLVSALSERAARTGERVDVLSLNDVHDYRDGGLLVRGFARNKARFALALLEAGLLRAPRLVVAGHVNLAPLTAALVRAFSPPGGPRSFHLVLTHGIEVWGELRPLRARALRDADAVLAVSDYTRRQMIEFQGVAAERIDLLPNALSPGFERVVPHGVDGVPRILTCCRLDPYERYKGVDHLIAALPAVRQRVPGARLVVVGDGEDRPRLEALARSLGVEDEVQFTGRLSDEALARRYAECGVFAMPSRKEGFGIVFLEAMRYGKPCIAARAGGATEVVRHGVSGFTVDFGDVPALAFHLGQLLSDPALAARYGEAGRRRLEQGFTAAAFSARLEAILSARLGDPSRPAGPSFLEQELAAPADRAA